MRFDDPARTPSRPRATSLVLVTRLAATAMVALLLAACAKDPSVEKQKHVSKGNGYLKTRKYNEAVLSFRNAVQIDANYADAHVGLARTYRRKGWLADARSEYEKALQISGDAHDVRLEMGQTELELSAPVEAEKNARLILQAEPRSAAALTLLGNALTRQNKLDEAARVLDSALAVDPRFADAHVARAAMFGAARKLDEAGREYGEALRIDPENAEAHLGLGRLYAQAQKWNEAEQEFQRVLKADPDQRGARLSLALVYSRQNRVDDAIKTLEASRGVGDVPMELARAELYLNKGDAAKAESIVGPLVRRYPGLLPARLILGNAYLAQRKGPQAVQEFDVLAKSRADNPEVKLLQGS